MKNKYLEIIKAQLHGFSKYSPIAEGDYAVILELPEKGFKTKEVVKVEKIVGKLSYVRKFLRSKEGWVHLNNLEKIKMVASTSDGSEQSSIPVRVEEVTTLKDLDPKLFLYFGKRIKEIFSDEMVDKNELGEIVPKLNPKIVVGDFLAEGEKGTEGFVAKWGNDKGVIYVNSEAHFPIDEIVSHEFSHILSFYSKELADELGDSSIQLGVEDEEMDESGLQARHLEESKEMQGLDEQQRAKKRSENYYLKPTEVFAHTEQMRYIADKFKNLDIRHAQMDDSLTPEQKKAAVEEISHRPITYYKRHVMARMLPILAGRYKIKDYTARKIYEALFDNIEGYIPNVPKQGVR